MIPGSDEWTKLWDKYFEQKVQEGAGYEGEEPDDGEDGDVNALMD